MSLGRATNTDAQPHLTASAKPSAEAQADATNFITKETRRDSFRRVAANNRQAEVLDCLRIHPEGLTAWEIASITNRLVHAVRPRLTELHGKGSIIAVGKKFQELTQRTEAVWRIS